MPDKDSRIVDKGVCANPGDADEAFRSALNHKRIGNPVTDYINLLENVLKKSNREMFEEVRDQFPEYISLLATQYADKAMASAENIENVGVQSRAYAKIAGSVAVQNLGLAMQIKDKIENSDDVAQAYTDMARAFAVRNPEQAIQIADKIYYPAQQQQVYGLIFWDLAKQNPQKAIQIANKIQHPEYKEKAYLEIVVAIAEKNPEQALGIAGKIGNQYGQDIAYSEIVDKVIGNNLELAKQIVEEIQTPTIKELAQKTIERGFAYQDPQTQNPEFDHVFRDMDERLGLEKKLHELVRSAQFDQIDTLLTEDPREQVRDYVAIMKSLSQ